MSFENDLFDYQMNDMLDISISEATLIEMIKNKHCLDKQRVKEVIIKVKQWEHHDLSKDWEIELIKELGLEQ